MKGIGWQVGFEVMFSEHGGNDGRCDDGVEKEDGGEEGMRSNTRRLGGLGLSQSHALRPRGWK